MIDTVCHSLATANVIWDVLDIRHGACPRSDVHGHDLQTNPVTGFELVGRCEAARFPPFHNSIFQLLSRETGMGQDARW